MGVQPLRYARGFFDLQHAFADRVCTLSGLPLERVLLEYTNFYVRFGLGREFDPEHPTWQGYLHGLAAAEDCAAFTYDFYLRDPEAHTAPAVTASFGCFSYALPRPDRVRLHFRNTEPPGRSPLRAANSGRRRAELSALFAHAKRHVDAAVPVVGVSWLYDIEAYRRLFPAAYTASPRVLRDVYRSMPLWGQFVDHQGAVKKALAEPFLAAVASQSALATLGDCFPHPILTVRAPLGVFYAHYGL